MIIVLLLVNNATRDNIVKQRLLRLEEPHNQCTLDNIRYWATRFNIQYIDIFMQQVILESGNLTSHIFRENNNLVGMRKPARRKTTAIGKLNGYAVYRNFVDAIEDYSLWQIDRQQLTIVSADDYYELLQRVYARSKDYVKRLKTVKNE
jgi:uncharacterized FlgJ-related protein